MKRTLLFLFSLLTLVYANALTWVPRSYVDDGTASVDPGVTIKEGQTISSVVLGIDGLTVLWDLPKFLESCSPTVTTCAYIFDLQKAYLTDGATIVYPSESANSMTPAGITIKFDTPLTSVGNYSLVIEDGFAKAVDGTSVAATFNDFVIVEGGSTVDPEPGESLLDAYTADPADGATIDGVFDLTITFTNTEYVATNGNSDWDNGLSLKNSEGVSFAVKSSGPQGNKIKIQGVDALAAGSYTFTMEKGTLIDWTNDPDPSNPNPEIVLHYTVGGGGSVVDPEPVANPLDKYTVTPEEGVVESLKTINVSFTGLDTGKNEYISLSDSRADVLINGETKNISIGTLTYTDLNLNLGITEAGEYTVVIPAGVVAYELDYVADWTKTNPEITLHYTVEGAVSTPLTVVSVDPADNATLTAGETLETIVTFPVYLAGLNYGIVTLKNEAGESFEVNCNTSGNGNNLLKITSKEALVAGNYTLTIPAGVVCDWSGAEADKSKVNPEIVLHYTVEGGETPVDYFEDYTSTFSEGVKIVSVVFPNAGDNVVYFAEGKSAADIVAIAEDGTQTPSNRANGATKTFNFQFSDVTADGTYTFEIPAGTLVIDDISNEKAITGSFTIEPKSAETYFGGAVFDPADGASVATLKVIKVTYSNVANGFGNIQYTTVKDKITLIGNGQTVNPIDVVAENSYPYQTINITFNEVTDAGEYTLNIEKGTFNEFVSWGETPTNFNEAVSAKFTVTGGVKVETFGDAEWTPAEGAEVESVEVVTVNFPNLKSPLAEFGGAGDITLTCEGKELTWYGTEISGTVATIKFAPNAENAITTPGEYTLTVPAGYFYDGTTAEECPELTLHFTVVAPKASTLAEYTVDPEDGYTFMEGTEMNVAIKFTKVEYISGIDFSGVTLVDENGASMDVTAKTSGKYGNVLEIKATGLKNSKYTLTVPAGTVCDYDGPTPDKSNANEEIVLHYTLDSQDGVSAIFGDADSFTVVTVDGVVLLKDADADALNQLPAGLYIVNGKKLVIRK